MQKCPKTFVHDLRYFGLTKQSYTQHSCEAGQRGQNWIIIKIIQETEANINQ